MDTTSSSFAGNDELVAVEDSIDVGNVLWIFYDCFWPQGIMVAFIVAYNKIVWGVLANGKCLNRQVHQQLNKSPFKTLKQCYYHGIINYGTL